MPSAEQTTYSPDDRSRYLTQPSEVDDALDQLAAVSTSALTTTDNAVARYNGTAGKLQNSGVTLDDSEQMEFAGGRLRHAGAAEVSGSTPSPTATGMVWLDTSASAGIAGQVALVTKTADYTATDDDTVIICDATTGSFTITLPTAVGRTGKVFYIKKIDSTANTVTIDGNGTETVDDGTTAVISVQYETLTVVSDGSEFWIL